VVTKFKTDNRGRPIGLDWSVYTFTPPKKKLKRVNGNGKANGKAKPVKKEPKPKKLRRIPKELQKKGGIEPRELCPAGKHDMATHGVQKYTKSGTKNGRYCKGCKLDRERERRS
jgi:hypothetical protein